MLGVEGRFQTCVPGSTLGVGTKGDKASCLITGGEVSSSSLGDPASRQTGGFQLIWI